MQTSEKYNILHNRQYQKALRIYHENKTPIDNDSPTTIPFSSSRKSKKEARNKLHEERKKLADKHFDGNTHALLMTGLRRENEDMIQLLNSVTSTKNVTLSAKSAPLPVINGEKLKRMNPQKRTVTLQTFAQEQAFALGQCSPKAIYAFYPNQNKLQFKHTCRCGRRVCPLCAHFDSAQESKMLQNELVDKLGELTTEQRGRGRLVHLTFTHENCELEQVMDILKAWRHIQQMKKREYKRKENPYSIWNVLLWGLGVWEVTWNEDTGLFHPHLHVLTWADGWLAPERGGYWQMLVDSWIHTCQTIIGQKADWEGQHMSAVCYFSDTRSDDPKAITGFATEEIVQALTSGAVKEMIKYPVKSTDFTTVTAYKNGEDCSQAANILAELLYKMHGRKLKNGFGGFKLREIEEEEKEITEADIKPGEYLDPEECTDELCYEVIVTWHRGEKMYKTYRMREWNQKRFDRYLEDLQDFKNRSALVLAYGLEDS